MMMEVLLPVTVGPLPISTAPPDNSAVQLVTLTPSRTNKNGCHTAGEGRGERARQSRSAGRGRGKGLSQAGGQGVHDRLQRISEDLPRVG